MATDYTIPKEEYRALVAENERLQEQSERLFDKTLELATENARLRSELESVGVAAYLYGRSDLNADNAKLRELVRNMYKAFQRVFPDGHRLDFEMDMRELGVEVTP